jgi:hypothetical protein
MGWPKLPTCSPAHLPLVTQRGIRFAVSLQARLFAGALNDHNRG